MRLMKVLLAALFAVFALVAGLLTAAIVAVASVLIMLVRRALRRRGETQLPTQGAARMPKAGNQDVIDVTATEVPSHRNEDAHFAARLPH